MYADWMKKIKLNIEEDTKLPIEKTIETVKEIKRPMLACGFEKQSEILKALEIVTNYIELMHSEFDRLEGIEDNTSMLKHELEKKDKQLQEKQNIINKLSKECQKKFDLAMDTEIERITANKVIDEMIKVIIDSSICDYFIKQRCKYYAGENKKTCDMCIKEYFYKKVGDNK